MGLRIRSLVLMLAGSVFSMYPAHAQDSPLHEALHRSVSERLGGPLVFSTRDTLFALSLPTDEPATIYLQLTVGRNGKVKEKQTKVHANHLAQYVAPAFVEAAKGLRVDRSLVDNNNKDTSLLVAFPLEYQCVYDTLNKAWPDMTPQAWQIADIIAPRTYWHNNNNEAAIQEYIKTKIFTPGNPWGEYRRTKPTRLWYYLAFVVEP